MVGPSSAPAEAGELQGGETGDDDGLEDEPDGADGGGRTEPGDDGGDAADRPQHVRGDDRLDGGPADPRSSPDDPDGAGVHEQEGARAAEQSGGQAQEVVEQRRRDQV